MVTIHYSYHTACIEEMLRTTGIAEIDLLDHIANMMERKYNAHTGPSDKNVDVPLNLPLQGFEHYDSGSRFLRIYPLLILHGILIVIVL